MDERQVEVLFPQGTEAPYASMDAPSVHMIVVEDDDAVNGGQADKALPVAQSFHQEAGTAPDASESHAVVVVQHDTNPINEYPFATKSVVDAYVFFVLTWFMGGHHFYLGRNAWGLAYLFTFGFLGFGFLVDLFRLPSLTRQANARYMQHDYRMRWEMYDVENVLGDSYVLLGLGCLGLHHFYLKRPMMGITYLLTFGLFGVGWVVDMFRMPSLVARHLEPASKDERLFHIDDAYVLWLPFGLLGLHHLYLRRVGHFLLYLCTFGMLGVGWFVDGFRMAALVNEANQKHQFEVSLRESMQSTPVGQQDAPRDVESGQFQADAAAAAAMPVDQAAASHDAVNAKTSE